jgi:hypothetical protein
MKSRLWLGLMGVMLAAGVFTAPGTAKAADYSNSRLMDDQVFDRVGSMSEAQIQTFLASKGPCLANYHDVEPIWNGTQWTYTGSVLASRVIYDVAIQWGLNPQVILATLEKEESLVAGTACDGWRYNSAMGYGCPDSGGCNPKYAGFTHQVLWGAWQLKFNKERAYGNTAWDGDGSISYVGLMTEGVRKRCDSCQSFSYDGNATIDGQTIHLYNGTTASLYTYTPHLGQSFPGIFESWFGSVIAVAWDYSFVSASQSSLSFDYGQTTTGTVVLSNAGNATWYADGSVPAGGHPVRLGLQNYGNSPFADPSDPSWLGTRNQIKMTPSVVQPGENATFTFKMTAPYGQIVNYSQNFVPVVDGVGWMRDRGMRFVLSSYTPRYSYVGAYFPPSSLIAGQKVGSNLVIKNTGNGPWYADGAVPTGKHPLRLASYGYQPNPYASPDDSHWLGTRSQVVMSPAVVNPGENATFTFELVGPYASVGGYSFHFLPVLDGVTFLADYGMAFKLSTPAPSYAYGFVSAVNPPVWMTAGSSAAASITLKNTGNVVWRGDAARGHLPAVRLVMSQPWYRSSSFYNSSNAAWLAPSQIAMQTAVVNPGENGQFSFSWKAPATPGSYLEHFAPAMDGVSLMADLGMGFAVNVTP